MYTCRLHTHNGMQSACGITHAVNTVVCCVAIVANVCWANAPATDKFIHI